MNAAWARAERLLLVRLDNLGDVLMCTPAMRALQAAHPRRRLSLLAAPPVAATLAPHLPELERVLPYAAPWVKGSGKPDPEIVARLRHAGFDGAIIFTCYSQSALPAALLCHQAGIPLRLAHCRENPYGLLSDWIPDPEPGQTIRHEVRRQLDLVAHIGARADSEQLHFQVLAGDRARLLRRLTQAGVDIGRPWLLLHPGASAAARRYPAELWRRLIDLLGRTLDMPLVLSGSAEEQPLLDSILAGVDTPAISLGGKCSLGEWAAAIAAARLLISNNSAPVHLAAALGTPVVDLYALTNPQHTPWQVPSRVLFEPTACAYCYRSECPQGHQRCLAGVSPERVLAAVRSLLEETLSASPHC
ncbi:glycosyltransferase family 9 protein [Massilia sp. TS11]|uniref:glycosyltransferase family 9 protein n=1 Tax=Massilia sp. TS11 TaxID=2908003 RepID=UPI001EDC01B0|nr:glycosyltransferase family 9 protein [Massilia sp. TS11]MCG2586865.1 glycosyltransferase family 9 protein [Massilia sp. TS11]